VRVTRTTCPYCGVGCGVKVTVEADGGAARVTRHPANFGRLCSKGAALKDTLSPARPPELYPMMHGRQASWDQALGHIAAEFSRKPRRTWSGRGRLLCLRASC
jgi:assimilatory nitrate reductase catalytic subunit